MIDFFSRLFSSSDFMPHGHCILWQPQILWLHVISDGVIALAYYSIPAALAYFVKKRQDLAFNWMFIMFAIFICACGTTHVMAIWTMWHPVYRLDGIIKLLTAVSSITTAIVLWPLIPKALALPSPSQLSQEMAVRQRAEEDLQRAHDGLETAVHERTAALHEAMHDLVTENVERKHAEQKLKSLAADLERSNRDLEQFAYMASHDLQEPLRMVTSFVQLLESRYKGHIDEKADEYIHFVVDGADRMQKMINSLLEYSRVARLTEAFATTDANTAVNRALENLRLIIQEGRAEITCDKLPEVWGSEPQLIQLFQNLIANAIKYRGADDPRIGIRVKRNENEWQFSVTDNGIGIEKAFQDRIFVIFRRAHAKEYPGSGIGLAVCKKIVELHGGRIWVESEPGRGATFHFTLRDQGGMVDAASNP